MLITLLSPSFTVNRVKIDPLVLKRILYYLRLHSNNPTPYEIIRHCGRIPIFMFDSIKEAGLPWAAWGNDFTLVALVAAL